MIIEANKVVGVHYTLTEGNPAGQTVESTKGQAPLVFIFGVGMMIPDFEANLAGMKIGDEFSFGIEAKNGYGEYDEKAIVEVPKTAFMHEGKIPDGLLEVGNMLPLQDENGNRLDGMVAWVGLDMVKIDFNHPMAGVDLWFSGTVDTLRDASADELAHGHVHGEGGHHHH